jgi:hypothetical protein
LVDETERMKGCRAESGRGKAASGGRRRLGEGPKLAEPKRWPVRTGKDGRERVFLRRGSGR